MFLFSSINFLAKEIIQALSWTLLHSLWQGVLFALIAGCIILMTKKSSSLQRYNLLATNLALFVLVIAITFASQLSTAEQSLNATAPIATAPINTEALVVGLIEVRSEFSIVSQVITFIDANANWLVLVWLLIICYKFIRIGIGFYGLYQLKRNQISSPGEYWNNRITELCTQLQINKKVQLLCSELVQIPAVVGYLKPVILFPAAMLSSMSIHEVEAVLIHELGHIRRKDFLVNMLQNIIEIMFFFNPAILWISSLLKTERENCCDDIAVANIKNKQSYVNALLNFHQFGLSESRQLVTAFSGESNHLLNRVKRIVYNNNKTLNNMEKKFLSAGLILASVCLFAFVSNKTRDENKSESSVLQTTQTSSTETPQIPPKPNDSKKDSKTSFQPVSGNPDKTTNAKTVSAGLDTVPVYKVGGGTNLTGVTNTSVDGKEYKIILNNSVVTELYIDGQKIPDEKIVDHKLILDRIYSRMIANRLEYLRIQEQSTRDSEIARRDSERAVRNSEQARSESDTEVRDSEIARKESERAMRDSEQAVKDSDKAVRDSEQARKDSERAIRDSEQARKDSERAMRDSEQASRDMEGIINELIALKIIKEKNELKSLSLNTKELLVNGVKQPSAIHKKLKDKYVKSDTVTLWYEIE